MTNDDDEKDEKKDGFKTRSWMLTIFEKPKGVDIPRTEEDIVKMLDPLPWCGQLEEGHKTHNRHFQIWLEAPNAIHLSALRRRCPDIHAEPRGGTKQEAYDYVVKDDTRVDGPYFHGLTAADATDKAGTRTDLDMIAERLRDGASVDSLLLDSDVAPKLARCMTWARNLERAVFDSRFAKYKTEDRTVDVSYVWGDPGIGKTHSIKCLDEPVFEPSADGRWDDYHGEDVILFDEFSGQIPLGQMNRYLEGYRNTRLPARYHDSFACYHRVFIVSNDPPEAFYNGAKSWLRRLKHIEHADWFSTRNIVFAKGESLADWNDVFNFVA